ncbi:hypothetical protein SERLADRAFT_398586, partial [Serpula lacrymans var. lacrymans S7.9]
MSNYNFSSWLLHFLIKTLVVHSFDRVQTKSYITPWCEVYFSLMLSLWFPSTFAERSVTAEALHYYIPASTSIGSITFRPLLRTTNGTLELAKFFTG